MVHADGRHHPLARLYPLGVLLLAPVILVLTAAILLGLLGIFVTWLSVVACLLATLVALDIARRSRRLLARQPVGAGQSSTIGYHRG
jgi:sterol desaturase/sphingolipid hydroxylase (fatty acid hydroxylase superfamily)